MPDKKKRKKKPSQATSEFLLPQPSAEGVRKLQALHMERTGEQIAEEDARRVLSKIMRFQYLNVLAITQPLPEAAESGATAVSNRIQVRQKDRSHLLDRPVSSQFICCAEYLYLDVAP